MLKSSNKFGIIAIASTAVIILLIFLLALIGFFVKQPNTAETTTVENSPTALQQMPIDPALATTQLGGIAPEDVINLAIEKSRPGTALATIISTPSLAPKQTAGTLLLLGEKFLQQNDTARAALSYQLAGAIATLSPDLSDTLRADVFLQAGSGLIALNDALHAKIYLDQAYLVATESNYLQPAYRQSILEQLNQAYLKIDEPEAARKSLNASLSPPELAAQSEAHLELPAIEPIPLTEAVQNAEKVRWQAAQKVAKNLVEMGGEVQPENLSALHDALLAEDAEKTAFFADALAAEKQLSGKANIIHRQIEWQSLKYRIARGGFGISLVPEWESNTEQIRSELTASYEALFRQYSDIIVAIPDASQIERATEELLRRQLLAGKLGWYPNYPAEQLKEQLLSASARLIETQPNTKLRVGFLKIDDTEYCTFVSDRDILNQTGGSAQPATP